MTIPKPSKHQLLLGLITFVPSLVITLVMAIDLHYQGQVNSSLTGITVSSHPGWWLTGLAILVYGLGALLTRWAA